MVGGRAYTGSHHKDGEECQDPLPKPRVKGLRASSALHKAAAHEGRKTGKEKGHDGVKPPTAGSGLAQGSRMLAGCFHIYKVSCFLQKLSGQ